MNCNLPVSLKARSVKTPDFLLSRDNLIKSIFVSVALLKKSPYRDITLVTSPVIKTTVRNMSVRQKNMSLRQTKIFFKATFALQHQQEVQYTCTCVHLISTYLY